MTRRTLVVFAVVAFLAATAGYSQSTLVGKIPFEFRVGKSILPAGEYELTAGMAPQVLRIRSTSGNDTVMTLVNAAETLNGPKECKLVFNRYGSTYFLSQVWRAANNRGIALPKTKAEREVARNASGTQLAHIPVTVR
jgi:hypothetical protein